MVIGKGVRVSLRCVCVNSNSIVIISASWSGVDRADDDDYWGGSLPSGGYWPISQDDEEQTAK